jgi:hypothetical protein
MPKTTALMLVMKSPAKSELGLHLIRPSAKSFRFKVI